MSPAVFCYCLMNEPVIGFPQQNEHPWLGKPLVGQHFVQRISKDPGKREYKAIAEAWVRKMTRAIRIKDDRTLVTVGVIAWTMVWPDAKPVFYAPEVAKHFDFVSVHMYPRSKELQKGSLR